MAGGETEIRLSGHCRGKRYGNKPGATGSHFGFLSAPAAGPAPNLRRMASFTALIPTSLSQLRKPWPAHWRVLATLALYAAYLPLSGYGPGQLRYDAAEYWELSLKFTQHGGFSLLAFDEPLRGYFGPLLILPARLLCHFTGWSMLTGARVLGAGWAAALFGLALPDLWARASGRPLNGGRWLALLALGFIFWRDYFNFTLSDMPALSLLLLGLLALGRRGWGWAGLAGALLAGAINIRPIYVAALPGVVGLVLLGWAGAQHWRRQAGVLVALAAGAALLLLPQLLINQRFFGQRSPLVLAQRPGTAPLYLRQLSWGTAFQRYETSLIPAIPRSLVYADSAGQRMLANVPGGRFGSYGQFLGFAAAHPLSTAARYARHLFNGLDTRYPTPYPTRLHPPGQALLRLLNYALLGLGLSLIFRWGKRQKSSLNSNALVLPVEETAPHTTILPTRKSEAMALLVALLLPCLLTLPTLMECRFLLPLHLLLLTAVAACWRPGEWWRRLGSPARRLAVLGLLGVWIWGCWQLSEATAGQRRPPREAPE